MMGKVMQIASRTRAVERVNIGMMREERSDSGSVLSAPNASGDPPLTQGALRTHSVLSTRTQNGSGVLSTRPCVAILMVRC